MLFSKKKFFFFKNKNYSKSKNDNIKFLNAFSQSIDHHHSQNNLEINFIGGIMELQSDAYIHAKLFMKYRKHITEYLYTSNACKSIDKTFLTLSIIPSFNTIKYHLFRTMDDYSHQNFF